MGHLGRRRNRHLTTRHPDAGITFVEILVAIVLLGTVVIGVLTAARATIISSDIERDRSSAQQWLLSGAAALADAPYADCTDPTDDFAIELAYVAALNTANKPTDFDGLIEVLAIDVWDGSDFVAFTGQGSRCLDDTLLRQQRVTIGVRSTLGDTSAELEVVKTDRVGS